MQTEITILCKNKGVCEQVGKSEPFFTAENILPGQNISRPLTIHNQRKNDLCSIAVTGHQTAHTQTDLASQLELQILRDTTVLSAYPLTQVLSTTTPLYVDTITANTLQKYLWQIVFKKTASNEYQGASITFDLNLTFTCDDGTALPTPSPTTTSTPLPTTVPTCTSIPPTQLSQLKVTEKNDYQAKLSWTKVPKATRYILNFRTLDNKSVFENIDLGTNTTYTVSALQSQQSYAFTITPATDCAVGEPSLPQYIYRAKTGQPADPNTQTTIPSATKTSAANSQNKSGQVLGTSITTTETPQSTIIYSSTTSWISLTILFIVIFILFIIFMRRKRKKTQNDDPQ